MNTLSIYRTLGFNVLNPISAAQGDEPGKRHPTLTKTLTVFET
jgi:hypothetical protein